MTARAAVVTPMLLLATLLAACSTGTDATPAPATANASASGSGAVEPFCGDTLREIAARAKNEGALTLVGLPGEWANYRAVVESFQDMYDIKVTDINPTSSSVQSIAAAESMRGQPDRPDALDVGSSFVEQAIDAKVVTPYRSTNWPEIPDSMKDPNGYWVGAYYGIMSIAVDTRVQPVVPTTWADLKDPRYRGQVTMNGDPRESGVGFGAVVAAALANGGTLDNVKPGIEYFADLRKSGNLKIAGMDNEGVLIDSSPVVLDWSYNFGRVGTDYGTPDSPIKVVIPSDGQYGAFYTQSVIADAVHPCAARLWIEHVTSDSGAMGFLNGLAIPARLAALEAFGLVRANLRDRLPTPRQLNDTEMSDPNKLVTAQQQVDKLWGPLVLGEK
mgnify:CR=1 FL=1